MEVFYYKCPKCGFIYQVPAYWMSYSAEVTTMFPHPSMITKQPCECAELELMEDQQ